MSTDFAVAITLLGGASLANGDRLERKSAALVALLALGGPSPRTRVAGMLWPESPERTARNNLAQTVRRLREAAGAQVVAGDQTIALADGVDVDVARIEVLVQRGQTADAAKSRGALLDGLDFDDCKELEDWIAAQRERVRQSVRRARRAESERLEREGRVEQALAMSRQDVESNPLDEEATRRRMRLLYRSGDTAEALRVYDAFAGALDRELGARPHAETEALADAIRDGVAPSQRASQLPTATVPLVGRAQAWEQVESAWKKRAAVLIAGAAGIGKSRLAKEFTASKGVVTSCGARPGDVNVPYATAARLFKQLATRPGIKLPEWARAELARIVPSLGPKAESRGAEFDKVRFYSAMSDTPQRAVRDGVSVLFFDDVQFADPASLEALEHALAPYWSGEAVGLKTVLTTRPGPAKLASEARGWIERVTLAPLDVAAASALVEGSGLDAAEVHAITAGNPFFVLEIVRGVRAGEIDARAGLRGTRAAELVAQRLEPLSSAALRLARVAAIAGSELDLALAAEVLETNAMDLAEPLAELAQAEIFRETRFAHDLLEEIVHDKTPAAVRAFVHERVGASLLARDAEPARAAHHFALAGKPARAAPLFEAAAVRAFELARLGEAADAYERAADLFESLGERARAFECIAALRRFVRHLPTRVGPIVERFAGLATSDSDRARAIFSHAHLAIFSGDLARATALLDEGTAMARDAWARGEERQNRFYVALYENDLETAERWRRAHFEVSQEIGGYETIAVSTFHEAQIAAQHDEHAKALDVVARFESDLEKHAAHHWGHARSRGLAARSLVVLGRLADAEASLAIADAHVTHLGEGAAGRNELDAFRVFVALAACDRDRAVATARAILVHGDGEPWVAVPARIGLAFAAQSEGRRREALEELARAIEQSRAAPHVRTWALLARAAIDPARDEEDARFMAKYASPLDAARFEMRTRPRDVAVIERAVAAIEAHGALGYLAEATAALAAAKNDAELARKALDLAKRHPPAGAVPGAISGGKSLRS